MKFGFRSPPKSPLITVTRSNKATTKANKTMKSGDRPKKESTNDESAKPTEKARRVGRVQGTPRERGRYDVEDVIERRKSRKSESRDESGEYPIIDRVPTAMGYHSDESEDEWLEEKSKCSRYDVTEHQLSADEDNDVKKSEREGNPTTDEKPDDASDRYSQKERPKKKIKKKKNPPDTISRLWSESTDSDVQHGDWREKEIAPSFNEGDDIYPEEKGGDPIYETSPKNKANKKRIKKKVPPKIPALKIDEDSEPRFESPDEEASMHAFASPAGRSDTSSLTDPLVTMLHFSATDKVVKEIEEKLKLLKKVAAEEKKTAKKKNKTKKKKISMEKAKIATKLPKPSGTHSATHDKHISLKYTGTPTMTKTILPEKPSKAFTRQSKVSNVKPTKPDAKVQFNASNVKPTKPDAIVPTPSSSQKKLAKVKPSLRSPALSCSKDQIELARSMSLLEPENPAMQTEGIPRRALSKLLSSSKRTVISTTDTIPTTESTDKSEGAGKRSSAMYTKSLLTEDSDLAEKSTMSGSLPAMKPLVQNRNQVPSGVDSTRHQKLSALCMSPSWRSGLRAKASDKTVIKNNAGNFWTKRARRSDAPTFPAHKLTPEKSFEGVDASTQAGQDSSEAHPSVRSTMTTTKTKKKKKKKTTPKELDEYSGLTKERTNEADLVQCLRYYSCGAVANHLNVAIKVAECENTSSDWARKDGVLLDDDILESTSKGYPSSPMPTVEVILDDATLKEKQVLENTDSSVKNATSCRYDDDASGEFLAEAPSLPLSRVPSIVVDVSEMQLHLDCDDSETEQKSSALRGASSGLRSDVSITSINFTNREGGGSEDNEEDEEEMELKDCIISKPNKKKGIRGLLSRFRKKR